MNILIIKLGALGDVLRTTPLLTALTARTPQARITWLVDERHKSVLSNNPLIAELLGYNEASLERIGRESYDLAINLDKEPEALLAIQRARATRKMGFIADAQGKLAPADTLSDYAYRLGFDDDLKFRLNQKSYQEICFEQVGLTFHKEEYLFFLSDADRQAARSALQQMGFDPLRAKKPVIGLNTGSGWRFAGKKLSRELYLELAEKLSASLEATVFLLGGDDERERNLWIQRSSKTPVFNTGSHAIGVFAAIVEQCQLIITGDTTAMHIAIAVKTPALVHFGATCASEIELYGRGRKLVSQLPCAPCYKKACPLDEACMRTWTADDICKQAKDILTHETTRIH